MTELVGLIEAVVGGDIEATKKLVKHLLDEGFVPIDIIDKGIVVALNIVGERYTTGEFFLPEMILSAVTAREGIDIATAGMKPGQYKPKATMIIGTVKGDLHDIGKNIVALLLRTYGFEVIDLGVDVEDEKFIEAVKEHKAQILGLSCLMTTTMAGMKDVMTALTRAGLREKVKVIIGGCPVTSEFASIIGADYFCRDAGSAAAVLEQALTDLKNK